jgi:hypothetical protein
MYGVCKSVSKHVFLRESEHMAALPSSASPNCSTGLAVPGALGLGLALAVTRLVLALIVGDLNAMLGGRNCTSRFIK